MAGEKEVVKAKESKDASKMLSGLSSEEYCYLRTTGRISGRPHEIEIWFAARNNTIYLLSGGGDSSDWVKNIRASPSVAVRIAKQTFAGTARLISDAEEDGFARHSLAAKYQNWREGRPLSEWARSALAVAIDLKSPSVS